MAKAAQADIEQVTGEISIQRSVEARGVKLARRGNVLTNSCPFHRSSKGTLSVEPKANTWTLLGHEQLRSTQVYTHVSIRKLQEVHALTHPTSASSSRGKPTSRFSG